MKTPRFLVAACVSLEKHKVKFVQLNFSIVAAEKVQFRNAAFPPLALRAEKTGGQPVKLLKFRRLRGDAD